MEEEISSNNSRISESLDCAFESIPRYGMQLYHNIKCSRNKIHIWEQNWSRVQTKQETEDVICR